MLPVGKLLDTPGLSFFGAGVTVSTPDVVLMEPPGIPADKNSRNLELFAKEVMPHLR